MNPGLNSIDIIEICLCRKELYLNLQIVTHRKYFWRDSAVFKGGELRKETCREPKSQWNKINANNLEHLSSSILSRNKTLLAIENRNEIQMEKK